MTVYSELPSRRRSRWNILLKLLAGLLLGSLIFRVVTADEPSAVAVREAKLDGYDQGYAEAMAQQADSVGAAYSTGYRAAQREAATSCSSLRGGL